MTSSGETSGSINSPFPRPGRMDGPAWAGLKVGVLGGSFNPAHEGHRHISLLALKLLKLDCIWWMVSPQNPLKSEGQMASKDKRFQSALDVSRHPRIIVTDIESKLGTQYTADTLDELHNRFRNTKFIWLMGTDNLHQIHKWQRWEDIFMTTPIAVFNRPPFLKAITGAKAANRFRNSMLPPDNARLLADTQAPAWTLFHTPMNPQSATDIRSKDASWLD